MEIPYKPAKPGRGNKPRSQALPKMDYSLPPSPFDGEWGEDPWDAREPGQFSLALSKYVDGMEGD